MFVNLFSLAVPSLLKEHFGSTPGCNLLVPRHKIQKFAAPLEFFRAPKGAAAAQLRTTDLEAREQPIRTKALELQIKSRVKLFIK